MSSKGPLTAAEAYVCVSGSSYLGVRRSILRGSVASLTLWSLTNTYRGNICNDSVIKTTRLRWRYSPQRTVAFPGI